MKGFTIPTENFVIFEGTHKEGEKAGQNYAFVRLDSRAPISNDPAFIDACRKEGVKVIKDGAVNKAPAAFALCD